MGGSCKQLGLAGSVAGAVFALCFSASAAETTYQRLLNARAEPQNWLMRMGSYGNWNHSGAGPDQQKQCRQPQGQIHGLPERPQSSQQGQSVFHAPVEDGFMYVGNQYQQYWKLGRADSIKSTS